MHTNSCAYPFFSFSQDASLPTPSRYPLHLFHRHGVRGCIEFSSFAPSLPSHRLENDKKYKVALKKGVAILKNKDIKSKADAIKLLTRATESSSFHTVTRRLKPNEAKPWCIMGKYYQSQRDFKKGAFPMKKCSSLDPSNENVLNYGIFLFDYGDIKTAKTMHSFCLPFTVDSPTCTNRTRKTKRRRTTTVSRSPGFSPPTLVTFRLARAKRRRRC